MVGLCNTFEFGKNIYEIYVGNIQGRRCLAELSVDGGIMMMLILNTMQVFRLVLCGGKFGLNAWLL